MADKEQTAERQDRRGPLSGLIVRGALAVGMTMAVRAAIRRRRAISFEGRVALITGGSRGLGLCLAREFAHQGASIAICARDAGELERAKEELHSMGADVLTVVCDVTDEADIETMIASVTERFGRLDVLVNNAGVIQVGPMAEMTDADYDMAMQTHFWGPLHCALHSLPWLRRVSGGRIVNIASIGGLVRVPHLMPYAASKFALVGLSEGLRAELAAEGITVTTVCPGLMRTGSHLNALFKGQHRKEFTAFALAGSAPGASVSADAAARRIVEACRVGDAELILGVPARLGALVHGIFPGLTADLWSVANRLLPREGGIGKANAPGMASQTPLTRSWITKSLQTAALRNNEVL